MRVLFISPWPSESGLSKATVQPHLKQLAEFDQVKEIAYVSVEEAEIIERPEIEKVSHFPYVKHTHSGLLQKALDHQKLSRHALRVAAVTKPDFVICRGAPAGTVGLKIQNKLGIPFCVESFEPHADYMHSAGVWSRWGPKYLMQSRWEKRIKERAFALITVSECYAKYLIEIQGLNPGRIHTVPCWVDAEKFRPDPTQREKVRTQLGATGKLTCVYVGKFGGIYYEQAAASALRVVYDQVGAELLIMILTPDDLEKTRKLIEAEGIPAEAVWLGCVSQDEVPAYLASADFAISFHISTSWSFAFSPIKHAEYWACGLPVMIPENVGDEAQWIESERAGVVVDMEDSISVREGTTRLMEIVLDESHRKRIRRLAIERRSANELEETYRELLNQFSRAT